MRSSSTRPRELPILQIVKGLKVVEEAVGIDDRHHGVKLCHLRERSAALIREAEGCSDGKWLGNAGRLNQQIVEAAGPAPGGRLL